MLTPVTHVIRRIEQFLASRMVTYDKEYVHCRSNGCFTLSRMRIPYVKVAVNCNAIDRDAQELSVLSHETGHYISYTRNTRWWALAEKLEALQGYPARSDVEFSYQELLDLRAKELYPEEERAWRFGEELIRSFGVELPRSFWEYFRGYRETCLATYTPGDRLYGYRVDRLQPHPKTIEFLKPAPFDFDDHANNPPCRRGSCPRCPTTGSIT